MDFSKFSANNFDAKEWVNGALRTHKDSKTPLDAHASTLVMKLQLFIQEVNNALEETSSQVVQNLPRVLRDVESVRQEALLLREQMQVVKEDIKRVETETSQSMQLLVELDAVKTRMLDSKNALQEADNWTTLSADVEEVFSSKNIEQISVKLIGMQQSLNVLHDVADYEERKKLLETLKNRLEALLSPCLTSAFNGHLTADAKEYVRIFEGICREQRVKEYYIQCHKNTIQQLWKSLQNPEKRFIESLTTFYDELLGKWISEYSWCSQVFPEPLAMLSKLFQESLESLSPPLHQCLHTSVHHSQSPIDAFIDLRSCVLRLMKNLEKSLGVEAGSGWGVVFPLVEVIHLPYCQLLVQFGSMEQQLLLNVLGSLQLTGVGMEETLQLSSQSVSQVFSFSATAVEHCSLLTEGWGVCALVKALEVMFTQYLKKLSSVLRDVQSKCAEQVTFVPGPGSGGASSGCGRNAQQDDLTDLQWAFQFMQCCGDFIQRACSLNSQLCLLVSSHAQDIRQPASSLNPFGSFDYLRMFHPEEHTAVMELLDAVEKSDGECLLLKQTDLHVESLTSQAHMFAFDILFSQMKLKLLGVPSLKVWETGVVSPLESPRALTGDLPSFSRSPLPYITEIGDYLLTLPQQLEPFTSQDNPALMAALQRGKLPYTSGQPVAAEEGEGHPSDIWLCAVAKGTMETYINSILQIPSIPEAAAEQLTTDIGYLCNVLAALDQNPSPSLSSLEQLLKADKEQFVRMKSISSVPKQLYQALSRQRTWLQPLQ